MNKKQAPKSETAAVPGPRCTDSIPAITRHGRIIAPALASTVVLFATIGLSRELFMLDSPTFPITSVRQRAAGELSKSPVAAAPPARFVDDESFSGIKQILQEGKEGDRLRPEDSSSIHAAPDTGLESGRKDKNSGEALE